MENNKLISIIIPVFNAENYLDDCINSVLNQDYDKWELILVNDGSTDSSEKICQLYADKDSRIKVISQLNGGPGKSRNNGIENASGDFIMFLDSDDSIKSNTLSTLMKHADDSIDLVQCLAEKQRENNTIFEEGPEEKMCIDSQYALTNFYFSSKPVIHYSVWGKLIRSSILSELSFQQINHSEDVLFTANLISRCRNIVYIPEYLFLINERMGSLSRRPIDDNIIHAKNVCADMLLELVQSKSEFSQLVSRAFWNKISSNIVMAYEVFRQKNDGYKNTVKNIVNHCKSKDKTIKLNLKYRVIAEIFIICPFLFLKIYGLIFGK